VDGDSLDDGAALRIRPLRRRWQALRLRRLGRRRHRSASLSDPDLFSRVYESDPGPGRQKLHKKGNCMVGWLNVYVTFFIQRNFFLFLVIKVLDLDPRPDLDSLKPGSGSGFIKYGSPT
jgi:hypothetical protein